MLRDLLRPRAAVGLGDLALAAGLAALCVLSWMAAPISAEAAWRAPDGPGIALALAMVLPVATRRRLPLPSMGVSGLAALATVAAGYGFTLAELVVWVLLGLTALATGPRAGAALAVTGATAVAGCVAVFSADDRQPFGLLVAAGVGALPCLVGDALRRQRELTEELRVLRGSELHQAVVEERLRIARDVHDSVGHHLSAISLQAQAGRLDGESEVLRTITVLCRRALQDTGAILGLLRDEPGVPAPVPRLEDLQELTATAELLGVQVGVVEVGPTDDLPDLVSTCGYRVVQEALTNVARHAAPARAELAVRRQAGAVSITVTDDGAPAAVRAAGRGLLGMRERVHAVGGTLAAAPLPGGGWRVHAVLPDRA